MFRQKDVRLIAVNDGTDTLHGDDDFLPFRNIMNEWYAKDTSKKIRSTFKAKSEAGKHVASSPPYGYMKDPDEVVRRIFKLTLEGKGPFQICKILEADKVEIPAYRKTERPLSYAIVDLAKMEVLNHNKHDLERMLENESRQQNRDITRKKNDPVL